MDSLIEELRLRGPSTRLVLMPLARVSVERSLSIGGFRFFPPGAVDIAALRPVPNRTLSAELQGCGGASLSGQPLREVSTSLTGFSPDALDNAAIVAFLAEINWDAFLRASHQDDLETLRLLSATAERALDLVRLHLCRLDLPDTLPGVVGSWTDAGPYIGALLYCLEDHESYLIAGEAGGYAAVTAGIGLGLDFDYHEPLPSPSDGEVAAIAVHAMSLLSDAMYSRNDTSKFIRTMTLLEFLASPDSYQNWKRSKGSIACHCAASKQDYLKVLDRLRELTSFNDPDGRQRGIRTLVVHHGKYLEEVIPGRGERRALFRELQGYCFSVVNDMLAHRALRWNAYSDRRKELKKALGVSSDA